MSGPSLEQQFIDAFDDRPAIARSDEQISDAQMAAILRPGATPGMALKHDGGKVRMELLPPEFLRGVAEVLTFGAQKYSAGNWASGGGFEWSRLYGALQRHLNAWANGEDIDPESGKSHLYHAGCMLAFLAVHVERKLGTDDRKTIGIMPTGRFPAVDAANGLDL